MLVGASIGKIKPDTQPKEWDDNYEEQEEA
jgi:hypothetical protein